MMHYLTRDFVCERLKIGLNASYKFAPATAIHRIPSDWIIKVLNRSRRAREEQLDYIPSDIITPDEAADEFGIPAKCLLRWTRRAVKVPPHYRLNKQTTRFRRETLSKWLERKTDDRHC